MWATIEGVQMKGGELGSVVIVPALDPWARAESEGGFPPLEGGAHLRQPGWRASPSEATIVSVFLGPS